MKDLARRNDAQLRIVTLNVWGLPDLPWGALTPHRDARVRAICRKLRRNLHDPAHGWDVVLIQEAWSRETRAALKACYPFSVDLDREDRRLDSGLLLLSRWPVDPSSVSRLVFEAGGDWLRAFVDGECFASKSAIGARILHPCLGPVWVANTHLISFYSKRRDRYFGKRQRQLRELSRWVRRLAGREPVVLGGDLNFGYESPLWDELKRELPSFNEAEAPAGLNTYLASLDPDIDPFRAPPGDQDIVIGKLDHLVASDHLAPVEGRVAFHLPFSLGSLRLRVSDHLGWESAFAAA